MLEYYRTVRQKTPHLTLCWVFLSVAFCVWPLSASAAPTKKIKNLILLIGDGMGPQQVALASLYARRAPNSVVPGRKLNILRLIDRGEVGLSLNEPTNALVIDSACSATQLAAGVPALSETIGLDATGDPVETILEKAKNSGRATGLVTDTRITHATPAAFAAHVSHRSNENEIASQLVQSKADVLLSAGLRHFLPRSANNKQAPGYQKLRARIPESLSLNSKRSDERNLLDEAETNGYDLAFTKSEMLASKSRKLLGLFAASEMPTGIMHSQTKDSPNRTIPTLKEMTQTALQILAKNPKGFFLMVEGGQIDWAAHRNDAGALLHEMLKFDEAIGVVLDWAKDREDTLVVLTADHETGSLGLSYSAREIPEPRKITGKAFPDGVFGPLFDFADASVLDRIFAQKQDLQFLVEEFQALPEEQQTPTRLRSLVADRTSFSITLDQAKDILRMDPNRFQKRGHPYLSESEIPHVGALSAFYVYPTERRTTMIARAIAEQQNIVWGTGTHTSTPVMVVADGPVALEKLYDGLQSADVIGDLNIRALGLTSNRK